MSIVQGSVSLFVLCNVTSDTSVQLRSFSPLRNPITVESNVVMARSSGAITEVSRKDWSSFVVEYNDVLGRWKEFVEKLDETLKTGWRTTAKPAQDLSSPVR